MAVRYHRKVKTNSKGNLNISKSGISHSQKVGKFTFNSRGTVSYNSSIKGLSFRMNILVGLLFIMFYWLVKLGIFMIVKLPYILIKFISKQLVVFVKLILKKSKKKGAIIDI